MIQFIIMWIGTITPLKVALWWKRKISSSNIAISEIVDEEKKLNDDVSSEASLPFDRKKTATLTRRKTFHGQIAVVDSKPKVARLSRSRRSVSDDGSLSSAGSSSLAHLTPYQQAVERLARDDRWKKETALGTRISFYRLYRDVGKGSFSKVKMGMHFLTKEKVAVKIIEKGKLQSKGRQMLSKEVSALESVEHPHVIRLFEVVDTPARLFLVMEFAEGGELSKRVAAGGRLPEPEARTLFAQVAAAVDHLHKHSIIHRDLKAENVFVSDKNTLKIGDFGFSTRMQNPRDPLLTLCGSPAYAAPEIFQNENYSGPGVDMWSMGVLLFFMVTASLPFKGETVTAVKRKILSGQFAVPKHVSKECSDLIGGLLQSDADKRFGLAQVKSCSWMKGVNFPGKKSSRCSEKEAMERLEKMGISEQLLREHKGKGARSCVNGTYRIVVQSIESSQPVVEEKENPVKALILSCPTFESKTCSIL